MCDINKETYNEKALFPPTIAVDFDGTLVENKFPDIGEFNETVLNALLVYQQKGYKIILWSCRTEDMLEAAVRACSERGLVFDAVNSNLPEVVSYFGGDTRKVFANFYWDDRSAALFEDKESQMQELMTLPITINLLPYFNGV